MALIIDPDQITQGTEITIDTAARTITLNEAGDLSSDGVTLQCLYSFLKEEWKTDNTLIPFPFPMTAITPEQFEFNENWVPGNDATRKLIRTGGWREVDDTGTANREYLGIITLGNIEAAHTAYYAFATDIAATDFTYTGPVNEAVQSFGDADNGDIDKRADTLTVYIREQGYTYDQTTTGDIGVTSLTNKVERFPLSEGEDLNISATDSDIETLAPYTSMGIEYFATAQTQTIGGTGYDFGVVISCAVGTTKEIYEFVQYQLRQSTDINTGMDEVTGLLADSLATFIGDRLDTLFVNNPAGDGGGVFLDNFNSNYTNSLRMIDNTENYRTYPFVAAGDINFNANLQNDTGAAYWMFFDYTAQYSVSDLVISPATGAQADWTSAGNNLPTLTVGDYVRLSGGTNAVNNEIWEVISFTDTGSATMELMNGDTPESETAFSATVYDDPINSPDAVVVQNDAGLDISGDVSGAESVSFDFDYDGNTQGGRTAATDAEILIIGLGLDTAQYVSATGTITRSTGLSFTLVAALERNYENPV